jgi:sugar phosphate isomerase/epimerase
MTLGPDDLVLSGPTVNHPPLEEHAALAAAAGFTAISCWTRTYLEARARGRSDHDLRSLIADHGLQVADVDCIAPVAGRGDDGEPFYGAREEDVLRAASGLGARSVNVVLRHDDEWSVEWAAAEFARVCDRAARDGLLVHLEPVPFMKVKSMPAAWQIVHLADRPNGGLQIDAWHHFRGPARDDDLHEIPRDRIFAEQLCDAPSEAVGKPFVETQHHRLVPGEGALDLAGMLRLVYAPAPAPGTATDGAAAGTACRAPLCVEIFSDALDALPRPAVAGRVGDAMRRMRGLIG